MGELLLISLGCTLIASLVFIPGVAGGGARTDASLGLVRICELHVGFKSPTAGVAKPCGVIHASHVGQRHKWSDTGDLHRVPADRAGLGTRGNHLIEPGHLLIEVLGNCDKRLQQRRKCLVLKRPRHQCVERGAC